MTEKNSPREHPSMGPSWPPSPERGAPAGASGPKPLGPDDVNLLRAIVIECAKEVFATCNIELSLRERAAPEKPPFPSLAAFIGFGGAHLRGSLTLVAPFSLMRTAYPLLLKDDAEAGLDVIDWAGEIANQLLGRIENKLSARGVELLAGTPKVLLGEHLNVPRPVRNSVCELRFESGSGEDVGIWFDASVRDANDLFARPAGDTPCANEGDLVLF